MRLDVPASAFGNPNLFSGREWDEELGYYYFRNRYMDPGLGRFISRDPLGLWGDPLNLGNGYTYAASSPWSLVDPFGLCSGNQTWSEWAKGIFSSLMGEDVPTTDYGMSDELNAATSRWASQGEQFTPIDPMAIYEENLDTASAADIFGAAKQTGMEGRN